MANSHAEPTAVPGGHVEATAAVDAATAIDRLVHLFRLQGADESGLITVLCEQAVDLLPEIVAAGVLLTSKRNRVEIVAATDAGPRLLNELQRRTGTGPCLTAATTQQVVRVDDMATDARWPGYSATATTFGVTAMLCLPLHVDEQLLGTVSLYAPEAHSIRTATEPNARLLAVLAALTLAEFRGRADLETALATRDLIGQAKGVLMATHRVTADEAFTMLVAHSQRANTKLRDVAQAVADTGTLP